MVESPPSFCPDCGAWLRQPKLGTRGEDSPPQAHRRVDAALGALGTHGGDR